MPNRMGVQGTHPSTLPTTEPSLQLPIEVFVRKYDINILPVLGFLRFALLKFRLSLKIEPGASTPRSAASREDLAGESGAGGLCTVAW